jgi:hypothetical protein
VGKNNLAVHSEAEDVPPLYPRNSISYVLEGNSCTGAQGNMHKAFKASFVIIKK